MYSKEVINRGVNGLECLNALKTAYTYKEDATADFVDKLMHCIAHDLQIMDVFPAHVLRSSIYSDATGGISVRIFLQPSKKAEYSGKAAKLDCVLVYDTLFMGNLVQFFSLWVSNYWKLVKLQQNINILNDTVATLISEAGVGYELSFALGDGVLDISDDHLLFGVSAIAENLSENPLFFPAEDECNKIRQQRYRDAVITTLKSVPSPLHLLKSKSMFCEDMGLYTMRMPNLVIRQNVRRKAQNITSGIGYIDTDDVFMLVKAEKTGESEGIKYTCYLSPFDKKTLIPVSFDYEGYLKDKIAKKSKK